MNSTLHNIFMCNTSCDPSNSPVGKRNWTNFRAPNLRLRQIHASFGGSWTSNSSLLIPKSCFPLYIVSMVSPLKWVGNCSQYTYNLGENLFYFLAPHCHSDGRMIPPPSLYHLFCSRGKCWEEVRLETLEKLLKTCREKRMGNAGVWDGDLRDFSCGGKHQAGVQGWLWILLPIGSNSAGRDWLSLDLYHVMLRQDAWEKMKQGWLSQGH